MVLEQAKLSIKQIIPIPTRPNVLRGSSDLETASRYTKPYENDFRVIKARTEDLNTVYATTSVVFDEILSRLGENTNRSFATSKESVEEKALIIALAFTELSHEIKLDDDEKRVINEFTEELFALNSFSLQLEHLDSNVTSEDLVRAFIFSFSDYSDRVLNWLDEKEVLKRYSEINTPKAAKSTENTTTTEGVEPGEEVKAEAADKTNLDFEKLARVVFHSLDDSLKPKEEEGIRPLQVVEFPKEKKFTGIIHKDESEGNGFYLTDINSPIDINGDQRFEQPGKTKVFLEDYNKLPERKSGEIDIELPVEISEASPNSCIILPTKLGYKAYAISFEGSDGKEIETYQNSLGVTILKNLNTNIKSVKYRLVKNDASKVEQYPDNWLKHFPLKNEGSIHRILAEALDSCKTREAFIGILAANLSTSNPVYSMDTEIQEITRRVSNYFEAQEAIGYIGHCEDDSLVLCNKVRGFSIPAFIGAGLTIGNAEDGRLAFQSECGHAKLIFLDENGIPKEFESTLINSKEYVLDLEKIKKDLPHLVKVLENCSEEEILRKLKAYSISWKIKKEEDAPNPLDSIGSAEYAETLKKEYEDLRNRDGSEYKTNTHFNAYKTAMKLDNLVKGWESTLKRGDLKEISKALVAIKNNECSLTHYIFNLHNTGEIPLQLARLLKEIKEKDFISEFKDYISTLDPEKRSIKCLEVLYEIQNGSYFSSRDEISNMLLNSIEINHLEEVSNDLANKIVYSFLTSHNDELDKDKISSLILKLSAKTNLDKHISYIEDKICKSAKDPDSTNAISNYLDLLVLSTVELNESLENMFIELGLKGDSKAIQNILDVMSKKLEYERFIEIIDEKACPSAYLKSLVGNRCKKGLDKNPTSMDMNPYPRSERNYYNENLPIKEKKDLCITEKSYVIKDTISKFEKVIHGETHHWSFGQNIQNLITTFEEVGISLKEAISKERAQEILNRDYLTPPKYWINDNQQQRDRIYRKKDELACLKKDGNLDLSKPCRILQMNMENHASSPYNEHNQALFFMNYFGIEIPKNDSNENQIWENKLKTKFEKRRFSLNELPKETALELISSNPEISHLLELFNAEWKHEGGKTKVFSSLFENIPESKEIVCKRADVTHKTALTFLFNKTVDNGVRYRFSVLLSILKEKEGFEELQKHVSEALEMKDLDKVKGILLSNSFTSSRNIEFRNELEALSDKELFLFSTMFSNDKYSECLSASLLEVKILPKKKDKTNLEKEINPHGHIASNVMDFITSNDFSLDSLVNPPTESLEITPFDLSNLKNYPKESKYSGINERLYKLAASSEDSIIEKEVELTKTNHTNNGFNILSRLSSLNNGSYWTQRLIEAAASIPISEIIGCISESGYYIDDARKIIASPIQSKIFSEESIFRNGNVSFLDRSGASKLYGRSQSGEFHTHRDYNPGDDIRKLDWGVYGRTDKYVIKETRDSNDPSPQHFIVDIEWLINNTDERLSPNIRKLVSILINSSKKRKKQNLHLFYRGEIIQSLNHAEIGRILGPEKIKDDFGERTTLEDFILNLNLLSKTAGKIKSREKVSNYEYSPGLISNNPWFPPSKGGTAFIITDNQDLITNSLTLFENWIKRHIDVRVARFS